MKNYSYLLCKLLGHKWHPAYQRHGHYYRIRCTRCGARYTKGGEQEAMTTKPVKGNPFRCFRFNLSGLGDIIPSVHIGFWIITWERDDWRRTLHVWWVWTD